MKFKLLSKQYLTGKHQMFNVTVVAKFSTYARIKHVVLRLFQPIQFLSSTKQMHTKENRFLFSASRCSSIIRSLVFNTLPMSSTHTRLTALCPGLPRWAGTRKVKPIWILLKQETVSGSSISWATCKSAPRSRQITTPAHHHSVFTGRVPSCRPTNSVKALKVRFSTWRQNSYTKIGRV